MAQFIDTGKFRVFGQYNIILSSEAKNRHVTFVIKSYNLVRNISNKETWCSGRLGN